MQVAGDFWRDGATCVRGAFDAADVERGRRAIDANLAELSPNAKRASPDGDGAFIEDFCSWQRIPEMEALIRTSPAAAIAGELMGADVVRLYHDHVLVKEPGTRQRTPWHQDLPYYNKLTLYTAAGFPGPGRRRVLSLRFLGDDIVHAPRPWTTSPPFPGLTDELASGAPMDHPLYPVLWRRDDTPS